MIRIAFKDQPIGEQTTLGKCLEKATFSRLRPVDRIRAYLLMIYPDSRSRVCIARVTGIRHDALVAQMQQDLKAGRILRVTKGHYQAVPIERLP
jgi:hypothetical protein